jgi:phosphomannomutase
MKLCREKAIPLSGDTGIKDIEKLVLENNFQVVKKGSVEKNEEIKKEYINFIKNFANF